MNHSISFGSACIDQLIEQQTLGYEAGKNRPVVACIAGPDGAGKSILALNLASTYAASNDCQTRVIYASTDLNYEQAYSSWQNFAFQWPKHRREILREKIERLYVDTNRLDRQSKFDAKLKERCTLKWITPFTDNVEVEDGQFPFVDVYSQYDSDNERNVYFLDLAAYSAGDDWWQINQSVGLLRTRFKQAKVPHLIVVDAVEGLEAMTGTYDRFGLQRSRRSRLAQLVRLARKSNCHILFVVEQKTDERLDEVFVSDLVVRLRSEKHDEYLQKTIEVEKARSVSHIRGMQELQIRNGLGTDNGAPDDPIMKVSIPEELVKDGEATIDTFGYLQVIPSLHQKEIHHNQMAGTA